MTKRIIAVNGTIGSGKDTFSSIFVNNGWERHAFADSLKDSVACIFGWDRDMLEGNTERSREWRETVDQYWTDALGYEITPRWVLQNYGTDILRKYFADDIWILSLKRKILMSKEDNIIITDCRFPNELKMVRDMGGLVVEVQRKLPDWYNHAVLMNTGQSKMTPLAFSTKFNIHSSEFAWVGINNPDHIIHNCGTLDELYSKALTVLHSI